MKILDKGFIKLVDHMGDDSAIVQSARVSYGAGTKTKREDDKLISYLLRNEHWTPFEMVVFKFHVKAPIFVARQWMRHRAGTFNEISARYSRMEDCFYIPEEENINKQSRTNKQGSEAGLCYTDQTMAQEAIKEVSHEAYQTYLRLLDTGVARETARMVLPVNLYTEFYWKVDLRNLFNFVKLRADAHAQFEIREYTKGIAAIIEGVTPSAYEAFVDNLN